jgi:hypothetical protein
MEPSKHVKDCSGAKPAPDLSPDHSPPPTVQFCESGSAAPTARRRASKPFGEFVDRSKVRRDASAAVPSRRIEPPAKTAARVPTGKGRLRVTIELLRVGEKLYFVLSVMAAKRKGTNHPHPRQWVLYETDRLHSSGLARRVFALTCAALDRKLTIEKRF